ncbi:MAG: amino acid decarboxylase [Cytophagaceae bacterium BCCC1]|nr:MAG: amino acid decarboxylase [Cytophagaceae bacterium BCCC1]
MENFQEILQKEETLDPDNWADMRLLAHKMVDDMMDYLSEIRDQKAWKPTTEEVRKHFKKMLPKESVSAESIYEDFKTNILPYNKGNVHPRFFSWVEGGGSPLGMMADMLASGMNPNVTIGDHSAMYVDRQVIDWCKEMINFPKGATGQLVTGGSSANITALIVAKNNFGDGIIKQKGLQSIESQLIVYCSSETHNCILKAAEVIGLGFENVKMIGINEDYTIDIDALEKAIAKDKLDGKTPFCIVGNAGTVNTGAIDDLKSLLEISKKENCWFHIDGAVGGFAKIVPEFSGQLKTLEMADSIALDLHKWLYIPYEIGCVLIRDAQKHRHAFAPASMPHYLTAHERGLAAGPDPIANFGMDLSRNFKALKVWMVLQEQGLEKYRRMLRQNVAQAFYLESLVNQNPRLELLTPVNMNIVCFRYKNENLKDEQLNALNKEILMTLHEEGIALPSYTVLRGKYAIRAAISNHRSKKEDFEIMVNAIVKIGNQLSK